MKKLAARARLRRWSIAATLLTATLLTTTTPLLLAQPLPPELPPMDPGQFKSQLSQTLVRLVVNRPLALAQHRHEHERTAGNEREEPAEAERGHQHITGIRTRAQQPTVVGDDDAGPRRARPVPPRPASGT